MSHPHDPVIVRPVSVDSTGCVQVFGLRYWSQDAVQHAGRLAEICIEEAPHSRALLRSTKGERWCWMELIEDKSLAQLAERESLIFRSLETVAGHRSAGGSDDATKPTSRSGPAYGAGSQQAAQARTRRPRTHPVKAGYAAAVLLSSGTRALARLLRCRNPLRWTLGSPLPCVSEDEGNSADKTGHRLSEGSK